MLICKQWPHSKCPRCGAAQEDTRQVIQCPTAPGQWTKALKGLQSWLKDQQTDPYLTVSILRLLHSWRQGQPCQATPSVHPHKRAALEAQIGLGAWNTLLGRISKQITAANTNIITPKAPGEQGTGGPSGSDSKAADGSGHCCHSQGVGEGSTRTPSP